MALDIGSASGGTGLAGEMFTLLDDAMDAAFTPDYDSAVAEPALQALADAIAEAIIVHFEANADLINVSAGGDTVSAPAIT